MKHLKHLAATVAMLLCCTTANAYSFQVDGIFYYIRSSSARTVEVTYETSNFNSYSGDVVIPATVTNNDKVYTVTSIGGNAFRDCSSLTSIVLPEGVTSIDYYAFFGCSSLTSIVLPEGVTSIGNDAFYRCSSLTSIVLPEGVTSIGNDAFYGCSSLTSIVLPEGVTSIGDDAFYGCSSLTEIHIASIESWLKISYGGMCSHPNYYASNVKLYINGEELTKVEVPSSVASIPSCAFRNCSSLTSIVLPESVTSIGDYAFYGCSSLTSIVLPEGVTSIGGATFLGCSSLTSIVLPEGVISIGDEAFYDCSSLIFIVLPESVTSIGRYAFSRCSSLISIVLPEGVTSIGGATFLGCSSLISIVLPEGVTSISGETFSGCSNLTSITIPENSKLTSIGECAFLDCSSLISIVLPEGVTSIACYRIFDGCSSLKDVVLKSTTPPALTSSSYIPTSIVFAVPEAVYEDYLTASYWKNFASQITIDDAGARVKSVTLTAEEEKSALHAAIGDEDLKFVTDLTISGSINSYDFMVLRNKMPLLRYLDLSEANIVANTYEHYTGYHTEDNKFPDYGLYGCNLLSLELPENITTIGRSAISSNTKLAEMIIPERVTSIEQDAFQYCRSLTSVTIPEGVISIGGSAFYGCNALESVVLPPTIKTIGYSAFQYCYNLTEIRIPSSIRSVDDNAFSGCDKLNDIYVYTVEPVSIKQNSFPKSGNNFVGTLHAPKVSYLDYFYDTQWSQFASFADFDEPYENFYLVGDKHLDNTTGAIKGEGDKNPDAEMGNNSGIIVEGDVTQDLGDVDIEHDGENGGSIIVGGEGCVNADELHFHINVNGGRWYFFCFPFDVRREDIVLQNGAEWVFRYYDGEERAKNGKGGWKNVTSDGNGNHLKAATGYIFQCSKDDVLILTAKNQKIKQEKKYNELVEHITQNAHDASWNFVGNPYLSYYEVTSDDYSAPITVWDGSKYIAIRPGDDDYQLAPFEAFFVQKPEVVANVDYSPERQMTYHQSQEAAAKARARRRTMPVDPARLLVNITLSNGTDTDQTRVVFNNDAALGYEATCDAAKFSTAGMPQLYTVDSRAVKYAINERPAEEGIVTMGYTAPAEGNYTLAAPRMDTPIVVKDNLTGTIHDFSEGDYTFMTQAGTFEDRFTVMTKAGTTGIDRLESTYNGQQSTVIYDAAGRRVEKMEQGIYIKENRKVVRL